MAKESSFDVVSKADLNEVRNAVNMAQKEIATRYDFKKSVSAITLEGDALVLVSDNEGKLQAGRRGPRGEARAPQGAAQGPAVRQGRGGARRHRAPARRHRQRHPRREGQGHEQADPPEFKKVKVQIQGDTVRVFSPSKDELQAAMTALREEDWGIPLQFVNYR